MKLCIASDYHGQYKHENKESFKQADVFIFCGDWTASRNYQFQIKETIKFFAWLDELPFKHKVVIAGNHDFVADKDAKLVESLASNYQNIHYLNDSSVIIDDTVFYGSPYTLMFCDWAFMETESQLRVRYERIPSTTDVLITHGPAYGILDTTDRGYSVGSEALLEAIQELPGIKLHCFGHIHEAYGIEQHSYIAVNASQLTYKYQLDPKPVYITI